MASVTGMAQDTVQPGTAIDNRASAYHFLPNTSDSVLINSNTVSAVINANESIDLVPNQRTQIRVGQSKTFVHKLSNTGNISTTVSITASNTSGDDYDLKDIVLSLYEPGKNIDSSTSSQSNKLSATLQPGDSLRFSVSVVVPNSANPGDLGNISVQATTEKNKIVLNNTDILEVLEGPNIRVRKRSEQDNLVQGDTLTYAITGNNDGDQSARSLNIVVDGNSQKKVILRDKIPANTTIVQAVDTQKGQPLFHISGNPEYSYTSSLPSDPSMVDEFAVAYDSLVPGERFQARFSVRINSNASGTIKNIARLNYNDRINDKEIRTKSAETNLVQQLLPEYDASLNYYTDENYNAISRAVRLGQPVFLQADAAACNTNSAYRDSTYITLKPQKTADEEKFLAIETGNNTGYFQIQPNVPTKNANEVQVEAFNNTLETLADDTIIATLPECQENQSPATAHILVSPHGVIFDSKTGAPVENAEITLIDVTGDGNGGKAGAPATVYNEQGTKEVANTQTTGENGIFEFPFVKPSTYKISVTTPAGYRFSSSVSPQNLPDDRTVDEQGSYGQEFTISDNPDAVGFDVPLDPSPEGILFIEKTSSTNNAAVGDFVTYQLTITNNSAQSVPQVWVEDTLPFGFKFEKGTALLDGSRISNPEGGEGPSLRFNIGDLSGNKSVTLTYRALLGPGSMKGDGINRAVATSDQNLGIRSNEARQKIEVRGGVFTDKGYIIGTVFADCNENDMQDPGEPGVPGVQLYLEDGSFVVTDSKGQYTFYGIRPGKHVLKIDNYSLPTGSKLGILDNRHAGDPSSRFVDLKNGQMHRADFSICNCDTAIHKEINNRKKQLSTAGQDEIGSSVKKDINADGNRRTRTVKREQASGILNGNSTKVPTFEHTDSSSVAATDTTGTDSSSLSNTGYSLEEVMIHEEATLGFIGLSDQDTLKASQTNLWVKSKLNTSLTLSVNGEPIRQDRISKKSTLSERNIQAFEFIGINLKAGKNTLTITEKDPFGNERGNKSITVYAPGNVENIALSVPSNNIPANGTSSAEIRVILQDESGVQVKTKVPITLDTSIGTWQVKDDDPSTPGTQTFITNGTDSFKLQAPMKPQDARVQVSVGLLKAETTVSFLPDLRPLIAAGIIEGTIRLNNGASIVPAKSADGFERELKSLSYSSGNFTADSRAAFFLKGKIKGDMLLTAGFDSEKDDDRLLRDIQPDEFYPVYGESSIKGYDAQSTGRLYVRVEKKRTYALYGDFITQEQHPAKSLGEYNRTQTGAKFHYEKDWVQLNIFGSQTSSLQRIEEFRGKGISGPYELQNDDILVNSEQVELITRDRNQPSIILERERLSRFRDYVIEPFTGNLMFKSPVSGVDKELNPIFIRVTYEVEDSNEQYLIAGADGQLKVTDFWEVGGSFIEDRNPEDNYRLKSANTTLRLGENTVLVGEVAESTTEQEGTGRGGRLELQHRGSDINGRVYAGQTNPDFVNRSSQLGQARTEAGARGSVKLTNSTNLKAELIHSSNDTLNSATTGGVLNVQQRFSDDIHAEVGVRYSKQNDVRSAPQQSTQDITNKNLRGKLTLGVPMVKSATVFGEYEQDIRQNDRRLIAVGGDYRIKNRGKVYARHEFISSALGQYNLNGTQRRQNTVIGLDTSYMQNGQVYSEYRVDNAFDGRNAQAAIGLRNRFEVYEGFGISAGLERIFSISGNPLNEGTSISTSVDYTANPLWKGTARAEARFSNNANSYLNTLGYSRKINPNWTFLGKQIFSLQTSSNVGTSNRIQERLRMGVAYRQTAQNRWDGLGRYELKYEENGQFGDNYDRLVHIFSTNVNYHPNADWTHSGRFATKKVGESSADFDSKSLTMLLSARTMYDITRRLDGGVNASLMTDADFGGKNYGAGIEVGYIVQRNLRLAVGFNLFGFEDRDLAPSNYTRKGVYLGFSYKFDERLFKGLIPGNDTKRPDVYATCECANEPQKVALTSLPEPKIDLPELQPVTFATPDFDYQPFNNFIALPKEIHFAFDKEIIDSTSARMLDLVAKYLNTHEATELEIHGFTDRSGPYVYNQQLSKRRAEAVQEFLITEGDINPDRIFIKGLSYRDTLGTAENDLIDRSKNRSVVLRIDQHAKNVTFVNPMQDLKMEQRITPSVWGWDYVFNPSERAVPGQIHFAAGSAQLNQISMYLIDRIILALQERPDAAVQFVIPMDKSNPLAKQRAEVLLEAAIDGGLLDERVTVTFKPGRAENEIPIVYKQNSGLKVIDQLDDVRLPDSPAVVDALQKMYNLLKNRADKSLIKESRTLEDL
jgi:uncharacterized repeat protein (TIGR01451 family)